MSKHRNRPGLANPTPTTLTAATPPQPKTKPQHPGANKDALPKPAWRPFYRKTDWLLAGITTLITLAVYLCTLAPDLTLEDSGELATASFYLGVPHPPGYPVWTLYTWLFTVLLPFSNIAWRVAVSSAVAGAAACGLITLVTNRFITLLRPTLLRQSPAVGDATLQHCASIVAGLLMAVNGYFWSQAVIVEVYTLSVLSLMTVVALLLRWAYQPDFRRYLYLAMFAFGVTLTNHMSLLVAAMGIEVVVVAVNRKIGRDMLLGNVLVYLGIFYAVSQDKLPSISNNPPVLNIIHAIGILSTFLAVYLCLKAPPPFREWKPVVISATAWAAGAGLFLLMPVFSATNPPMNWGYPRTPEGFLHAVQRGQYQAVAPTDDPFRYGHQIVSYISGAADEFHYLYLLLALVPFCLWRRLGPQEKRWLIGLTGLFLFLSAFLLLLINPGFDRAQRDLTRVFFTASHVFIAIFIGTGIATGAWWLQEHIADRKRKIWSAIALLTGLAWLLSENTLSEVEPDAAFGTRCFQAIASFSLGAHPWLTCSQGLLFLAITLIAAGLLWLKRRQSIALLGIAACLFPVQSFVANWEDAEQHGHLFGFWYGHDMFKPPFAIYPEMAKGAVLYGGTDPGRFCPTYMIFCESFIQPAQRRDPDFDRRDVYIITQNALADATYQNYIRAHYNRSTQTDTPFFQNFFHTPALTGLDDLVTWWGKRVEDRHRQEGVFPPKEIYIPNRQEAEQSFSTYIRDVEQRWKNNQLLPGEQVNTTPDGHITIGGQTGIMQINGAIAKIIFDKNPDREFYVEESLPIQWMYPYALPYGIILKLNRQPVQSLDPSVMEKDHAFWSRYSNRLIGNWITYDTPVKDIAAFIEKTYVRHNHTGFPGDPKFLRDDQAQKSFSKLRQAIAGIYNYHLNQTGHTPEMTALLEREIEFALKQAWAFCPYNPDVVVQLCQIFLRKSRFDEIDTLVATGQRIDPNNHNFDELANWVANLKHQLRTQQAAQATRKPNPPAAAGPARAPAANSNAQ